MKRVKLTFVFLLSIIWPVQAQDTLVLDEIAFLKSVMLNSPYVKSVQSKQEIAEFKLLEAKAPFQPVLGGNYATKDFEGKQYYSRTNAGIEVLTPYGLKVKGGYQDATGVFLNPEANVPPMGLTYLTFELPLGAGLFTDNYRTDLRLARLNLDQTQLDIQLKINEHLMKAATEYWKWQESLLLTDLAQEAVVLAQKRFEFVREQQSIGEYAGIDTLEALINLQNRMTFLNEQTINEMVSRQNILAYLGAEADSMPLRAVLNLDFPEPIRDSAVVSMLQIGHPLRLVYDIEFNKNEALVKLAREYFKPQFDLKYSLLQDYEDGPLPSIGFQDDYVIGIGAKFPIFLRKERAKVGQYQTQQQIVQYEKRDFENHLAASVRANLNQTSQTYDNVQLWRVAAENYLALVRAEQERFFLGESTIFMVNNRELRWIESRRKYIKNYVTFRLANVQYYYIMATLPDAAKL